MTSNHQAPAMNNQYGGLANSDRLDALDEEARSMMLAIKEADLDSVVPFCPGWTLRDLAAHLGWVYRWAGTVVAEGRAERPDSTESRQFTDPDPTDDAGLITRLDAALESLVRSLRSSNQGRGCWTIWPTEPRFDFWVRRMLHETLIHRVDVENAGQPITLSGAGLPTAVAADGIDEMICGFAQRYSETLRTPVPGTLAVVATDADVSWWARLGPEAPEFGRGTSPYGSEAEVKGSSGELLLLLWNRRNSDGLAVDGRLDLLYTWASQAHL